MTVDPTQGASREVAILSFHAIEEGPGPLCMPPAVFERQVERLHEAGCRALTPREIFRRISSGQAFPERAIAFTFDDGYASVHGTALRVLDAFGFTAAVYPVTAHLGDVSSWNVDGRHHMRLLDPSQLRELHAAGWEVGGHTHTHPPLPRLSPAEIAVELSRSNGVLEELTREPVMTFAYPYGLHDPASRAAAGAVYDVCMTTGASRASIESSLDRLERVEAWYLRHAWQLDHLHDRFGHAYLVLRRGGRALATTVRNRPAPKTGQGCDRPDGLDQTGPGERRGRST